MSARYAIVKGVLLDDPEQHKFTILPSAITGPFPESCPACGQPLAAPDDADACCLVAQVAGLRVGSP